MDELHAAAEPAGHLERLVRAVLVDLLGFEARLEVHDHLVGVDDRDHRRVGALDSALGWDATLAVATAVIAARADQRVRNPARVGEAQALAAKHLGVLSGEAQLIEPIGPVIDRPIVDREADLLDLVDPRRPILPCWRIGNDVRVDPASMSALA